MQDKNHLENYIALSNTNFFPQCFCKKSSNFYLVPQDTFWFVLFVKLSIPCKYKCFVLLGEVIDVFIYNRVNP